MDTAAVHQLHHEAQTVNLCASPVEANTIVMLDGTCRGYLKW